MPVDTRIGPSGDNLDPRTVAQLMALHIAEYSALMSRCNTFTTWLLGFFVIVPPALLALVQQWLTTKDPVYIWLGGAVGQALLHIWITVNDEQYKAVLYINKELRRSIVRADPLLNSRAFWRYEIFLGQMSMPESWWGEWIMLASLFVLLGSVMYWRRSLLLAEILYIIPNLVLFLVLAVSTHRRVTVRRQFAN